MSRKRISLSVENDDILYRYVKSVQSSGGSLEKAKKVLGTVIKDELNDNQANLVRMYYFNNVKQADIAERLNINQSTVSRTLARARKKLSSFLKYLL